jgi:hypothetical protein
VPYRQRDVDERPPEAEQAGIVGDLVRQFADPYAFFRELVQNAIDAGSTDIRVDIARDAEGALLFSVSDAGEGMDRDILENKLLVLFRSGKEGVEGKIGKFGIGFVSVLAIKPSVVKVQSTRGGKGHTLHLYADHSYELFEHPPAASGTTVTLVVPIPKQKADARIKEHVQRSRVSLQRWCEHAQIPIRLRVDESAFGDGGVERIDRELQLDGVLCSVRVASSDGHTIVLAGLRGSEGQRAAFYNRGLLLTETEEPLGFPGLVLKVQDSELEHTLSRDNVRRDQRFHRALERARGVVDTALRRAVHDALQAATQSASDYHQLATAVAHSPLDPVGLPLRLLHPRGAGSPQGAPAGRHAYVPAANRSEPLRGARGETDLTLLLAKRGELLIDLGAIPDAYVRRLHSRGIRLDESWSEALSAVELTPPERGSSDERLLARVTHALNDAYRDPRDVQLGKIRGAHANSLCIGQPDYRGRPMNPFTLLPFFRVPLILNVSHPLVIAARRHGVDAPDFAADMLTRAILRSHEALTPARSERLLTNTLAELLGDVPNTPDTEEAP